MKKFTEKHKRKFMVAPGIVILAFLASSALSIGDDTRLSFEAQNGNEFDIGETAIVDVIFQTETPVNVIGSTVRFPNDILRAESIDKSSSFLNLWTEEMIDNDEGIIRFSGGTTNESGFTGTDVALSITFETIEFGEATLAFEDTQVFASDGRGTQLESETVDLAYVVEDPTPVATAAPAEGGGVGGTAEALVPNSSTFLGDLNGDRIVNIVDVSILAVKILGAYDIRYDLNEDGELGLADLSVLFAHL